MKKVLSFVLVLAMILGSVSAVFATPVTLYKTGEVTNEKTTALPFEDAQANYVTTILRDLGVIEGDNGNINVAGELTRAEAAALVVKAMGLGDLGAVKTTTKFTDVKKDAWYSGYVAVAAANHYVDGNGNKFNPDAKLTMDEAVALILKVLGFSDEHLEGAWPVNFRDLALAQGILTNVEVGTQLATRGDLFQILYNVLVADKSPVVWNAETTQNATKGYHVPTNGLKLLEKMTRKTSSWSSLKYEVKTASIVLDENFKFANKFDASAFYGHKVNLLYKDGKAIGVAKDYTTKEVTGTFAKGSTISNATFTAIDGTVYTNVLAAGPTLYTDIKVFENGYSTTSGYAMPFGSFIDDATLNSTEVTLVLICDKTTPEKNASATACKYDYVNETLVVTATEAALIADANLYKFVGSNEVNTTFKAFGLTNAGLKKNLVIDSKKAPVVTGAVSALNEIQKDDVVELYINPSTKLICKVVVTRDVVTGAMTKYNAKAATYTVNGKAYTVAAQATDVADLAKYANAIKGASEYAFKLNAAGKIVTAKLTKAAKEKVTYRYAYVLECGTSNDWTYSADKKTMDVVSNAWIKLMPLDTMVEEKYELVSPAGLVGSAAAFVGTTAEWKSDAVQAGTFVKFAAKEDELKALDLDAVTTAAVKEQFVDIEGTVGTFAATKLTLENGTLYFKASTEFYVVDEEKLASASGYAKSTATDLNKAVSEAITYKLDKNGYVDVVIVGDYTVEEVIEQITVAAIVGIDTDENGTFITFIQPGKTEETLYVTGDGLTFDDDNVWVDSDLYKFTLTDGRISGADYSYNGTDKNCGELKYSNGVIVDLDGKLVVTLNPTTYFFSFDVADDEAVMNVVTEEDDINDMLDNENNEIEVFEFAEYDLVVIYVNENLDD